MNVDVKNMSDEDLYLSLQKGKALGKAAFEELYERFSTKIFTYCSKMLNNREIAEDVFQDIFVNFYESSKKYDEMTNVSGFLIKIARNLCINERQRKAHSMTSLENLIVPVYDEPYDKSELKEILDTAIEALPKKYREALILKEYVGFQYNEIAEALDMSMSTVKTRIYRAKNKLRELLSPYLEDMKK